jgi:hypothetical protein
LPPLTDSGRRTAKGRNAPAEQRTVSAPQLLRCSRERRYQPPNTDTLLFEAGIGRFLAGAAPRHPHIEIFDVGHKNNSFSNRFIEY